MFLEIKNKDFFLAGNFPSFSYQETRQNLYTYVFICMSKTILGLAPMDGFTDCAFRQIVKEIFDKYGEKDSYELLLWTEFMNADGYCINPT